MYDYDSTYEWCYCTSVLWKVKIANVDGEEEMLIGWSDDEESLWMWVELCTD